MLPSHIKAVETIVDSEGLGARSWSLVMYEHVQDGYLIYVKK